jgi:hypothetical protein
LLPSPDKRVINRRFICAIRYFLHNKDLIILMITLEIIKDFLMKVRNPHRKESGTVLFTPNPGNIRPEELLVYAPFEFWPVPYISQCSVSFCHESIDRDNLHTRLSEKHKLFWNNRHFHSSFTITSKYSGWSWAIVFYNLHLTNTTMHLGGESVIYFKETRFDQLLNQI